MADNSPISIRIPKNQLDEMDQLIERGEFPTRSSILLTALSTELARHRVPSQPYPIGGDDNADDRDNTD